MVWNTFSYQASQMSDPESTTETFASGAFFVNNDRRGVPFFFRTGKRLTEKKRAHVNIVFKQMDSIFGEPLANILTISNQQKASHSA